MSPVACGDRLFLRVERQTLSQLPETGAILFTIRVHVRPLARAIQTPAVAARLAEAIRALPDALQRYKNIGPFRPPLLAWLDGLASGGGP